MSLAALKQRIAEILDPPRTQAVGLPTGIAVLDTLLGDGGVPRGRLTEVLGPRGGGKTTLVRGLVEQAVRARHWVAYIDATRTLAPADWTRVTERRGRGAGDDEALWVVRPRDPARGAWCADVLLRSGAFALVVLDGAPPLARAVAVRLAQCAREADAALVVVGEEGGAYTASTSIAVRLRVARRERGALAGAARRTRSAVALRITVEKGGGGVHQTVEVGCAIGLARRLCADPAVPDRRGVAPARGKSGGGRGRVARPAADGSERGGGSHPVEQRASRRNAGGRDGGARSVEPSGRAAARKRRCAEPHVEHASFLGALG